MTRWIVRLRTAMVLILGALMLSSFLAYSQWEKTRPTEPDPVRGFVVPFPGATKRVFITEEEHALGYYVRIACFVMFGLIAVTIPVGRNDK